MQAYRESPPNSSRRKRVFIILSLLTVGAFVVFIPIQVFGQLLGLLDNPMRTAGYAQFTIVASIFFGYSRIITRYNLVKVELDQVGEGLFRDIESPVLLLSTNNTMLRANPAAQDAFEFQGVFEKSLDERPVTTVLPDFDGDSVILKSIWIQSRGPKNTNVPFQTSIRVTRCSGVFSSSMT